MGIKSTRNGGANAGRGDNPHFSFVRYEAPAGQVGSTGGKASFAVPRDKMPAVVASYKDWRQGTNTSGTNEYNQKFGPDAARKQALTRAASGSKIVTDAVGREV